MARVHGNGKSIWQYQEYMYIVMTRGDDTGTWQGYMARVHDKGAQHGGCEDVSV